jgi:hypothetical protein
MFRKKLIIAFSVIYILWGLSDVGTFLSRATSNKSFIDLGALIGSILALYVGYQLLQLHESGRRFALFLLYIRLAINSWLLIWFFLHLSDPALVRGDISFLGKQIYKFESPYAGAVFLFLWTIIVLATIVFLSQRETKKIFAPNATNASDVAVESM